MSDEDYEAMLELAVDLPLADARLFIRAESGCGLREAHMECERTADRFPGSTLHKSVLRLRAKATPHQHGAGNGEKHGG